MLKNSLFFSVILILALSNCTLFGMDTKEDLRVARGQLQANEVIIEEAHPKADKGQEEVSHDGEGLLPLDLVKFDPYKRCLPLDIKFKDGAISQASGFIIRQGYALTAAHAVYKPWLGKAIEVSFVEGEDFNKHVCCNIAYPQSYHDKCWQIYKKYEVFTNQDFSKIPPKEQLELAEVDFALLCFQSSSNDPEDVWHQEVDKVINIIMTKYDVDNIETTDKEKGIMRDYSRCIAYGFSSGRFQMSECSITQPLGTLEENALEFGGEKVTPGMSGGPICFCPIIEPTLPPETLTFYPFAIISGPSLSGRTVGCFLAQQTLECIKKWIEAFENLQNAHIIGLQRVDTLEKEQQSSKSSAWLKSFGFKKQ